MRKIFITGVLCLMASASFSQKLLDQDIRGRSCSGGLGRCIRDVGDQVRFDVTKLSATVLVMETDIAKLSPQEQLYCFGKPYAQVTPGETLLFAQNEAFTFDQDTLLYLELDPMFPLLEQGKYPVEVVDGKVRITLSLAKGKQAGS